MFGNGETKRRNMMYITTVTGVYSATTLRHFLVSGTYRYTYRWVHAHNFKTQKRGFALYRLEGIDILDLQFVG